MEPLKEVEYLPTSASRVQTTIDPDFERSTDIGDFLAILRRRRVALVLPMIVLFAGSIVYAWSLPELYRSTATILIEQQEIPEAFVSSTVSTYASERIEMITQRVLTTSNLRNVIEKFNLYPELRKKVPIENVVDRVRNDFDIGQIKANRGRNSQTIAFRISYVSRIPIIAQTVANELSSLYLEENLKTRRESAADTTGFLVAEADRLGAEISKLEASIADFKKEHMGRLPNQLGLNLQILERTEQQIKEVDQRIRLLEDRKIYIEAALTRLKSNSQGGANPVAAQIEMLRAQLRGLLAVYTSDHPDVKRLRKEIGALESQITVQAGLGTIQSELDGRRAELAQALEQHSPKDPEVMKLQQQVTNLELSLEEAKLGGNTSTTSLPAGSNHPNLQIEYRSADKEIARLLSERITLQAKVATYEKRIDEIPKIENEYSVLIRDRDNVMVKYNEIRAKISNARVAENLENANKAERFLLIEPANRPVKPFKPNRRKILTLGLVASIGAGIGAVVLSEALKRAVHGSRGVIASLGAPPLAFIPYIENARDRRRRFGKKTITALAVFFLLLAAVAIIHLRVMPLDVFWAGFPPRIEAWWMRMLETLDALWTARVVAPIPPDHYV